MIDRKIAVFFDVFVGVSGYGSWSQDEAYQRGVTAQMSDTRKNRNVGFTFIRNGGNEVGRFIAGAAVDEVQAFDAAHFFDFWAVYTDQ